MTKLTNGERLVKIETQLEGLDKRMTDMHAEMKAFITLADNVYARKSEVDELRSEIAWGRNKLFEIGFKVATIVGMGAVLVKLFI